MEPQAAIFSWRPPGKCVGRSPSICTGGTTKGSQNIEFSFDTKSRNSFWLGSGSRLA